MKVLNFEQGSPEWIEARRCKVTGTKLADVMGSSLARLQLICELIAEKQTEQTKAFKATAEMERGTAEEEFGRKLFEVIGNKKVNQVGICISDEFDWLANSPDGLIGKNNEESIEIKCPDTKKAVFYKITQTFEDTGITKSYQPFCGIPAEYKWQVVSYFLVNENLQKLNFCVYDSRFINEDHKLTVTEVKRENEVLQEAINQAKEELIKFRADWLKYEEQCFSTF